MFRSDSSHSRAVFFFLSSPSSLPASPLQRGPKLCVTYRQRRSDSVRKFPAGDDGCLVWDVVEGACTASLEGPAVRWAACLEDGRHLLCASGDRTSTLWDLSTSTSSVAIPGSRGSRVKSWAASQVRGPSLQLPAASACSSLH